MKNNLTIGMATYNDYDGVYFTIQSLRAHHGLKDAEFVVLDNSPAGRHQSLTEGFVTRIGGKYVRIPTEEASSWLKYRVKDYSTKDYCLVLDSHVLIESGGIDVLCQYLEANPDTKDLIQGPAYYDNLSTPETHMNPILRGGHYGVWGSDPTLLENDDPYEIELTGMACFAFRTKTMPDVSPLVRGYGSEEGSVAELIRKHGGRNICLPKFGWIHRFDYVGSQRHPAKSSDQIWNFFVAWMHIDIAHPMIQKLYDFLVLTNNYEIVDRLYKEALQATKDLVEVQTISSDTSPQKVTQPVINAEVSKSARTRPSCGSCRKASEIRKNKWRNQ
jgi:hypothetical protein